MTHDDRKRIEDLALRLAELERRTPGPAEQAIFAIARQALLDEITNLCRSDWLRPYREPYVAAGAA